MPAGNVIVRPAGANSSQVRIRGRAIDQVGETCLGSRFPPYTPVFRLRHGPALANAIRGKFSIPLNAPAKNDL
jgi:hypothetical protein